MSKFILNSFKRDKIKLKSGLNKKQADVALLLAHNQGKISCACTVHDTHLYLSGKTQHVTCLTFLSAVVLFVNCRLSCLKYMSGQRGGLNPWISRGWVPETSRSFHYWWPAPRWRLLP